MPQAKYIRPASTAPYFYKQNHTIHLSMLYLYVLQNTRKGTGDMKLNLRKITTITTVAILCLLLTACDIFNSNANQDNTQEPSIPEEQEIEVAPHPTIKGGAHVLPDITITGTLPELIFSRVYINSSNDRLRLIAITNTTDRPINLSDYKLGQRQGVNKTYVNNLPEITLGSNATVYIPNSSSLNAIYSIFPTIANLETVEKGNSVPAEATMKYKSMRLYTGDNTYEIIKNPVGIGKNPSGNTIYSWKTVDIVSVNGSRARPGSSLIRIYEPSTMKDYGWRILDQDSKVQNKIMDNHDNLVGGSHIAPVKAVGLNHAGGGTLPLTPDPTDSKSKQAQNTFLGEPAYRDDSLTDEKHWLISRPAYTLSFNHDRNISNWVSWHIDETDLGKIKRPDKAFKDDPAINPEWEPVLYSDYHFSNYGFDRGHMCPNADRNNDGQSQLDTFYMTNMVPQAEENNRGVWADLEENIRRICVRNGMEVYVISGPSVENGGSTLAEDGKYHHPGGTWEYISSYHDNGQTIRIDVPAYTWKVFLALPNGTDDIQRINENPDIVEAYAVWMPNSDAECKGRQYDEFRVSIDFIEEMTGYDFFSELTVEAQDILESRNNMYDPIVKPVFTYDTPELKMAM